MYNTLTSRRRLLGVLITCAAAAVLSPSSLGADDDEIVALPATAENRVDVNDLDANFDQWVFQGSPNAATGRQRLETQIKLQVAEMDRACELSPEQKERLMLAARGELQRFIEQVEVVRRKFEPLKNDQDKMNRIWEEIQPLQQRQARGLTGPETVLAKIVDSTLTEDQRKKYDAALNERRRFRYEASIGLALNLLESSVALTKEQRQALRTILLEFPPPKTFGQYDYLFINYRLANVPPARIQKLFDTRQWQALQQPLAQAKGMRQHLIDQGYLPREGDAATPEVRP